MFDNNENNPNTHYMSVGTSCSVTKRTTRTDAKCRRGKRDRAPAGQAAPAEPSNEREIGASGIDLTEHGKVFDRFS